MCRMIGIKHFDYDKHKDILTGFLGLARDGKVLPGDSTGHTDGWGIGYYKNRKAVITKSGHSANIDRARILNILKTIQKNKYPDLTFTQVSLARDKQMKTFAPVQV